MKNEKWFALDIKSVEKKLKTNAASGLSRKAARSRWNKFEDMLFIPNKKSVLKIIGSFFADFSLILLLLVAVVSLIFDDFQSGISVIVLSALSLGISFFAYYRSQRTLESLEGFFRPTARVIRNGKLYNLDYRNIVLGDVILVERGDIICADVRLVSSASLAVSMRTDADNYIYLEKNANELVNPKENDVTKYSNMLHAGSVIEQGSARGIVTALGRYTYLGALTGGILEKNRDNVPQTLKSLKKLSSRINMLALIAILPFCIISFFVSQGFGAEVTLSKVFLTALAAVATTLSQLSVVLCEIFYIENIKKLVACKDPSVFRGTAAFEKFANADYLFFLDGSPFLSGEITFDSCMTYDGEVNSFDTTSLAFRALADTVGIYLVADRRSLSSGISVTNDFEKGVSAFCKRAKVDFSAISIRYPNISVYREDIPNTVESVKYNDMGKSFVLSLSYTPQILSECSLACIGTTYRPLEEDGRERLKRFFARYLESGKKVLIITTLDLEKGTRIFVGMLAFGFGIDGECVKKLSLLEKSGINPILFQSGIIGAPEFPNSIEAIPEVSALELKRSGEKITYNFGKYHRYIDTDIGDICKLIDHIHSQKKRVAILGFSDYAAEAIEKADVFISCAPVCPRNSGRFGEEMVSLDDADGISSGSSIQMVKAEADILIPRFSNGRGGIAALIRARSMSALCVNSLSQYLRYLLCVQTVRICTVIIPMLFGSIALDARHILACGFIMDLTAFFAFVKSARTHSVPKQASPADGRLLRSIKSDKYTYISAIAASAILILLPMLWGFTGIGGGYLYQVEFSFNALIYLHFAVFLVMFFGTSRKKLSILKSKWFVLYFAGIVIFIFLSFTVEPLGILFDIQKNPFPYSVLSFVPALSFVILDYCFIGFEKKNK